jgi:Zn-dependent protease
MANMLREAVFVLVPMILSLTVHEYAHARSAWALGDDTAASMGRMNLNPLSHIDVFGTIVLPLLAIWGGGPFFGWAKPVPINPVRFSHRMRMKTGILLTAAAGPASNLLFALVVGFGLNLALALRPDEAMAHGTLFQLGLFTYQINIVLAVFNFIPVPPLDGSRVLAGLLPDRLAERYAYLERNPIFVILAFAILITQAGRFLAGPVNALAGLLLSITAPLARLFA